MKNNLLNKYFNVAVLLFVLSVSALSLLPLQTFAQTPTPTIPSSVAAPQTTDARCTAFKNQFTLSSGVNVASSGSQVFCSASGLILFVINYLLAFSGIITILFLVIGGFMYMTSAGNEEQSEKGKKILVNAVIGLIVITMSYAIVRIVGSTLALK